MPPSPGGDRTRWHSLDLDDVIELAQTDQHRGLNDDEIAERLRQFGANALVTMGKHPWYRVLARQFADVLVIILFLAALISLLLGDLGDAITILVIVVFNGTLAVPILAVPELYKYWHSHRSSLASVSTNSD